MAFIEAKDYRFYYPEQVEPAIDLSYCHIPQGTICLLAGPSGCGKTTFLRQLAKENGLQGREEGTLTNRAEGIAYVWQEPENQIVTDSVSYEIVFGMENQGMPAEQMRRRLAEVVTAFGLEDLVTRDTMALSGGEKQILNVASSLAMNPELMILDEPTSQLDPVAAARLYALLHQINEELGVTIVIAEQRLEDIVPLADQMICMKEGRIVAAGDPRMVFDRIRGTECEEFFPSYMQLGENLLTKKEARIWLEKHYRSQERGEDKPHAESGDLDKAADTIVLKRVYFRYGKKEKDVLDSCSVKFPKRKRTCLVGGNGSGKTTLLRLLAGHLAPYQGKMLPKMLQTSYLPQNPSYLFLEESVRAECDTMTEKGRELAQQFGLTSLLDRHPSDLSGGEKQRLALCRVLGKEAELFLLDEPTKGLDAGFKRILGELLHEMVKKGKTVLFVSHDMEFAARHADEIAFLYQGQIVIQTEARVFFEENQFYTTSMNRVARRVNPHIITLEDVAYYAEKAD